VAGNYEDFLIANGLLRAAIAKRAQDAANAVGPRHRLGDSRRVVVRIAAWHRTPGVDIHVEQSLNPDRGRSPNAIRLGRDVRVGDRHGQHHAAVARRYAIPEREEFDHLAVDTPVV